MTKRALVSGSSGFIGRHMTHRLRDDGWDVTGIDLKPAISNEDRILGRGLHGDARSFFRTNQTCYDLVVHCAAHVGGRVDIEGRPTYVAAMNLQLDGALFEWALRTRPAHIIYWSSSAVYPVAYQTGEELAPIPLTEDTIDLTVPLLPDATYGWVKLTGERLATEAQAEGLRVHVFRPFSGWGSDQSLNYPVPSFLDRARRRVPRFDVWGSGDQVRDFVHVRDIITTALTAVEQDYPGPLNICSGTGTSFNQLADIVCRAAGYEPVIRHLPTKPVGVHYRVGDPTEMMKVYPGAELTPLHRDITTALADR